MFDAYRNETPNCDPKLLVPLKISQPSSLYASPSSSVSQSLFERNAIANKIFRKLFHRKSRRRNKEDIMATAEPNAPKSSSRQSLNGQMMLKYTNVVKGA